MKKFYLRSRIMLITFAIGLASVYIFSGSLKGNNEIKVNLPEFQSDNSVIYVSLPKDNKIFEDFLFTEERVDERDFGGGYSGGETCDEARAKLKNKKTKIPNCD